MKQPLRILHVEDSIEDSELIRHLLLKDGVDCEIIRVETRAEAFDKLQNESIDLILADVLLPNFNGMHALEISRALKPDIPFVFVSGTMGEEKAIESLRNGATDYVLKDRLSRLIPAVRRALAEAEERNLRRQLQHRLREVARLEAVSTLSNGIAHDFNNILTIILGHASLLTIEHDRPERVLELTATITAAARRASEVVQQLLAFAHRSEGHAAPTDLNRRIQEILNLLKGGLPPKIEVTFDPTPDLPNILADFNQLERVLHNLLTNAFDSMPEGGQVKLSTKLVTSREIPDLVPEAGQENYVCLSVSDTGLGMDATTRDHIFEPFFTTKKRGRGTGLGLAVVYGLMQVHNGWIHVDSEPGKGTTVLLFFPVPRPTLRKKPSDVPASNPAFSGTETLLVVEDEADVAFFLETILQSHGYQVVIAHDYDQALQAFLTHQDAIDLVFSDIGLPKIDGITLCAELRERRPDLKLIMSSGYSPKEFKERLEQLAAQAFLPKPYTTQSVLRCVRKILDGKPAA
jgi:signal transduction histidine kinase